MLDMAAITSAVTNDLKTAKAERDAAGLQFQPGIAAGQIADALIQIKWELTAIRIAIASK